MGNIKIIEKEERTRNFELFDVVDIYDSTGSYMGVGIYLGASIDLTNSISGLNRILLIEKSTLHPHFTVGLIYSFDPDLLKLSNKTITFSNHKS